jgi:hypothetical protein
MPVYTVGVVGESHTNLDGSSRQLELECCERGEVVLIEPEPENAYDASALKVMSKRGVQIGYINRDHNEWIGEKIAQGAQISSLIHRITGGTRSKPSRGVVLTLGINVDSLADFAELFDDEGGYYDWLDSVREALND